MVLSKDELSHPRREVRLPDAGTALQRGSRTQSTMLMMAVERHISGLGTDLPRGRQMSSPLPFSVRLEHGKGLPLCSSTRCSRRNMLRLA